MVQYKKNWQLKNMAKDSLIGNYSEAILLTITYGLVSIAHSVITTLVMSSGSTFTDTIINVITLQMSPSGYLTSLVISLFFNIMLNLLTVGVSLFYLNIACNAPYSIKNLLIAFHENPIKYLLITLVQVLVSLFFALPGYICNYFYLVQPNNQWLTLSNVCHIAGQAVSIPIVLALSQSYRLLLDYPSLSTWQALTKSVRLMKGHKARLFLLMLSFLPLEIAVTFTCGIGYLWLSPYMNMTYTHFYLDIMKHSHQKM